MSWIVWIIFVYDDAEGDAEADDGGDVTDVEPDDDDDEEADEGDADDTPTYLSSEWQERRRKILITR